ncbi:MAG: hypothetical protein DRO14_03885, partial [Thermoprotei archaeon]
MPPLKSIDNSRGCGQNRKRELKNVLEKIKFALELSGRKFVVLHYPAKHRDRSIDIVAIRDNESEIIRVKLSARVSREESKDLIRASKALDAVPMIVTNDPELYDNIVYEKEGVYVINDRTFENLYLRPNELITLYKKGDLYVSLNKENFRKLRSKLKLTIGDVAFKTGISRRTIYSYEREGGIITIETAERLLEVFGEEVIQTVNLKVMRGEFRRKHKEISETCNKELLLRIRKYFSGKVYEIKKSAPDFIVSSEDEVAVYVDAVLNKRKYTLRDLIRKTIESIKLSDILKKSTAGIMLSSTNEEVIKDELSSYVDMNKVNIIKISD